MFTRQWGRLSFALQLPRTAQAKLKKQYFQPLTLLNIEADIRQQVQLQKISEASLLSPLPSLLSDPSKLAIGLFVCEFLYHALRDEQRNEPLFDYVRTSIEWLDGRERDFANFHLVFLMRLSRFLGFYPNLELRNHGTTELRNCENSLYFDLRAACFCEQPPLHRDFLMPVASICSCVWTMPPCISSVWVVQIVIVSWRFSSSIIGCTSLNFLNSVRSPFCKSCFNDFRSPSPESLGVPLCKGLLED